MTELGQKIMRWAEYEERIQRLPNAALRYIIKDAQEAIDANPQGLNAGYYADEMHICAGELHKRAKKLVNREQEYQRLLYQIWHVLKEAGYNSYEMLDDLRNLVNDSQRPATEEIETMLGSQ